VELSYQKDHQFNFKNAKIELDQMGIQIQEAKPIRVPWFPRSLKDVDKIGQVLQ
jgi:hypothetical protein